MMCAESAANDGLCSIEAQATSIFEGLLQTLVVVDDPRKARGKRYGLAEILGIAILGCLCGCDNAEALEDWGKKEKAWLLQFFPLRSGTPSQDVFLRVLAVIDPAQFRGAFLAWTRSIFPSLHIDEQIAIDGQTHRGTRNRAKERSPLHMVHALACTSGLVVGQQATDVKSNEITAIPALLELFDLRGALVSIDAMGCQVAIAKRIVEKDGDYLFGLKGNQSSLHAETKAAFVEALDERVRAIDEVNPPSIERATSIDAGHGRIETRTAMVSTDFGAWVPSSERWPGLTTIIAILAQREDKISGSVSTETRYYVSSRQLTAEQAIKATRCHWQVENNLHWCLDVTFGQDASRIQTKNAAENFAVIRHFSFNLLRNFKGDRYSMPRRRRLCDYDPTYRKRLLGAEQVAT